LPEEQAVALPDGTDFAAGACLGIPALTALQAVRLHGEVAGRTLLVTGAGSAVGHYATQIARARGARVIGTASDARAEHAREAGADAVVDYAGGNVAAAVKDATDGRGVDGIIDMDLSSTISLIGANVVKPHGTIVCYGSNNAGDLPLPFPAMLWNSYALKFMLVYELTPEDRKTCVAELTAMLEQRALRHGVGARFPFDDIAAAHEAVEGGKVIGNVVMEVGG
jgi:NADPH2:quinone reductase